MRVWRASVFILVAALIGVLYVAEGLRQIEKTRPADVRNGVRNFGYYLDLCQKHTYLNMGVTVKSAQCLLAACNNFTADLSIVPRI